VADARALLAALGRYGVGAMPDGDLVFHTSSQDEARARYEELIAALAQPSPEGLDVERLARALATYDPGKAWMARHKSWTRPDPADAEAIAAAYASAGEGDA